MMVMSSGVRDDGHPEGISDEEFRESLKTIRRMASGLNARVHSIEVQKGIEGKLAKVVIRREECR